MNKDDKLSLKIALVGNLIYRFIGVHTAGVEQRTFMTKTFISRKGVPASPTVSYRTCEAFFYISDQFIHFGCGNDPIKSMRYYSILFNCLWEAVSTIRYEK